MKIKILFIIQFVCNCVISQTIVNVDAPPMNIGGKAEFKRIFEQELIFPEICLSKKAVGKVSIEFVVMKDSSVAHAELSASTVNSELLNDEALRIFNLIQWVPATKDGQAVTCSTSVSFEFNSEKYSKICKSRGFINFNYLKDYPIDSITKVYKSPEQFPMYYKGNYALQDFIKENLEYPRQAQLSNIQGTVILRFVVEPSGLVTNIGIQKSVGGGCDQEAIRILQQLKWYPAKNKNKFVRAQMTLPIYFILNEDFKDNSAGEQK